MTRDGIDFFYTKKTGWVRSKIGHKGIERGNYESASPLSSIKYDQPLCFNYKYNGDGDKQFLKCSSQLHYADGHMEAAKKIILKRVEG